MYTKYVFKIPFRLPIVDYHRSSGSIFLNTQHRNEVPQHLQQQQQIHHPQQHNTISSNSMSTNNSTFNSNLSSGVSITTTTMAAAQIATSSSTTSAATHTSSSNAQGILNLVLHIQFSTPFTYRQVNTIYMY